MTTSAISQPSNTALIQVPVFTGKQPGALGPRCLPVTLVGATLVANPVQIIDLQNVQARKFIDFIQTIFVDNSLNLVPISINIAGTGQTITVGGQTQGYYPVLCPNPPKFTVSAQGASANINFEFLNVYLSQVWTSANAVIPISGGLVQVADPALDALISSGALAVRDSSGISTTSAVTRTALTGALQTVLAANPARTGAAFFNEQGASTILYLKAGAGASATSYTIPMAANSYYELPFKWQGVITGLSSTAAGFVVATEFTP